mmetsp:Transcript_5866/g.8623  ORF Transcript_5866/g.8623 Transcript_5866/m.8623 type:complete len:503 (+) Transcript_5866:153-1661(+)|eukprot:CAMPEP_0172426620 /NCGR_PEP_ID=MMETSP1064-20121228/38348_1 /TAXON_ID=202472 /ORGANISM="Aulacoseira subarctica , Strain CCAP 1002/5" /LENGTH=502 /DNA_ID=CAMNT_0013170327 /DNA_START=83 /DNA_END=1591 /DNA_ORIENTATION=+
MSSISNGGGRRGAPAGGGTFLPSVDFYRRVPKDLTESTILGITMSVIALILMTILFFSETIAFARSSIVTSLIVDESKEVQLRINFNLTFLDLHCDYIVIDVLDALGTNRQNVTKNVEKWQLDSDGQRRIFSGRNREQREVVHEEHAESLSELHENGVHAVPILSIAEFDEFVKVNEMVFIDFFAPWCIWCQRLHPTWEKFAEEVAKQNMPLRVATVNCVEQKDLCSAQKIDAFPLIRWYRDGKPEYPEYRADRTVAALTEFSKRKIDMNEKYKGWEKRALEEGGDAARLPRRPDGGRPDHPGCQVSGHIFVNRVPGNFHVEARSKSHNLNAAMTNLTHIVNHLSFGSPDTLPDHKHKEVTRLLKQVPPKYKRFYPLDHKLFETKKYHQAYHHYIKVVQTHFDMSGKGRDESGRPINKMDGYNAMSTYQFLRQSQVVLYDEMTVPEARFSYDLSPMSVLVQKESRKWYDYVTSLCAIIGGAFTTFGLIDASLYRVLKSKKVD